MDFSQYLVFLWFFVSFTFMLVSTILVIYAMFAAAKIHQIFAKTEAALATLAKSEQETELLRKTISELISKDKDVH